MPQHPRCAAILKDGSPCDRVTATPSGQFCSHHTELLATVDAETMRQGQTPKEPGGKKERPLRVVAEPERSKASKPSTNGATVTVADPATVRRKLAEAAAENVEQLKASLLEAAGSAVKPRGCQKYGFECSGARGREGSAVRAAA